jgi:hypothetical protein
MRFINKLGLTLFILATVILPHAEKGVKASICCSILLLGWFLFMYVNTDE